MFIGADRNQLERFLDPGPGSSSLAPTQFLDRLFWQHWGNPARFTDDDLGYRHVVIASLDPPERTADGRHIVVDGRRWRASDPGIPDKLRAELVAELMDARRAVSAGRRSADEAQIARARSRVHDAKVALGERGEPWWDPPTADGLAARITATANAVLRHRDQASSICPSDVARVVGGRSWRDHLDRVRSMASNLSDTGEIVATQGDNTVEIGQSVGPVRLRRGPRFPLAGADGSPDTSAEQGATVVP